MRPDRDEATRLYAELITLAVFGADEARLERLSEAFLALPVDSFDIRTGITIIGGREWMPQVPDDGDRLAHATELREYLSRELPETMHHEFGEEVSPGMWSFVLHDANGSYPGRIWMIRYAFMRQGMWVVILQEGDDGRPVALPDIPGGDVVAVCSTADGAHVHHVIPPEEDGT